MNIEKRAQAALCRYLRTRYEMIHPIAEQGLFNQKCFHNAVEHARLNPEHEVIETIYIDNGQPILHYLNRNPETGQYLETTLGYRAEHFEYYKIRKMDKDDYKWMESEFDRAQQSWLEQFVPWVFQKLFRIKRLL